MSVDTASPDSPRKSGRGTTYPNIMLGVMAAAMVAVVALLATIAFYLAIDHRDVAQAKEAEVDRSALATQVTQGIQRMMNRNDSTKDYRIRYDSDMALFQVTENGSEYQGIVTARTRRGTEVPVSVTVFADENGGSLMYQVDPKDVLRVANIASDEQD